MNHPNHHLRQNSKKFKGKSIITQKSTWLGLEDNLVMMKGQL
jgi:hypothetical protein